MGNRAVIYCRVSTIRQAKDELPIESQLESCRRKAMDLDLAVEKTFLDEGLSASNDRRPAFQDAVIYCEVFEIDYFITWSSSRFARNRADAAIYKRRLDAAGTKIVYVSMDIDTSTTPGWMIDGFMELADEYYSRQTSDDTTRSMMRNARAGYWNGGHPPYGYRPAPAPDNAKRRILVPVDEEAEVVNLIFELRANHGLGSRAIMQRLNSDGYTNRGKIWRLNTIADLLKNHAVIGQTVFNRTSKGRRIRRPKSDWIIVDSHPPIIDRALFDKVQATLAESSPTYDRADGTNILVGSIRCATCGNPMHVESARGRSQTYYYYFCRAAKLDKVHEFSRHRADLVDDRFLQAVLEQAINVRTLTQVIESIRKARKTWDQEANKEARQLQRTIDALEKKNSNLTSVLADLGRDTPNLQAIIKAMQANTAEIEAAKMKMRGLRTVDINSLDLDIDIEELRQLLIQTITDRENIQSVRAFLRSFIAEVQLDSEQIKIKYDPRRLVPGTVHISNGWLPGPRRMRTAEIVVPMPEQRRIRRRRA